MCQGLARDVAHTQGKVWPTRRMHLGATVAQQPPRHRYARSRLSLFAEIVHTRDVSTLFGPLSGHLLFHVKRFLCRRKTCHR